MLDAQDLPDARKQVMLENIWRRVYIQDECAYLCLYEALHAKHASLCSWASLKSAVGLNDDEIAAALRNTAFYATLAGAAASGASRCFQQA